MTGEVLLGVANDSQPIHFLMKMANRHGLIAGATGTGKTVTLRVLAESFSEAGVPVFMADVKGDLAGISQLGEKSAKIEERIVLVGDQDWKPTAFPVIFWDVFGSKGHPVRVTISELGPFLLARLLNLNDTQSGVLTLVFKVADDNGYLLLDLKDLQSMLKFVGENAEKFTLTYGNVSAASIGAIQRGILALQEHGGESFFGEPALNVADLMQTDSNGRGIINILAAEKLMLSPKVYSTFLLWLLSELFEHLPEAGDLDTPKMVFFFDEAHLLFDEAPKALLEKIEQVVRLIRSKGVGVYFVTQTPMDIPDSVLSQLGNRVQHALRAFTAKDQRAIRATAENFRADGTFDVERSLGELAIGEAIVSLLNGKGIPTHATRTFIAPPRSRLGAITDGERREVIEASLVKGVYDKTVDRESAYEKLQSKATISEEKNSPAESDGETSNDSEGLLSTILGSKTPSKGKSTRQGPVEAFIVSAARTIGGGVGRSIVRGILGSLSKTNR
jgi:DNA helicase HerA-like ATPase